jgi:hypothetical protein
VNWNESAYDRGQWRASANTVTDLRIPWKRGNFLTGGQLSFSRERLLHGVNNLSKSLVGIPVLSTFQLGTAFSKKVKLSLCFFNWAPRNYGVLGSGGIAPLILDLGTRWRWVVSFTPLPLYPQGKSRRYPLDRRLGGTQSRSGRCDKEEKFLLLPGIEPRASNL